MITGRGGDADYARIPGLGEPERRPVTHALSTRSMEIWREARLDGDIRCLSVLAHELCCIAYGISVTRPEVGPLSVRRRTDIRHGATTPAICSTIGENVRSKRMIGAAQAFTYTCQYPLLCRTRTWTPPDKAEDVDPVVDTGRGIADRP
jgi:hypothetical protein